MKRTLGIAVPALELGGGVPAVALFLASVARGSGRYDVRMISLSSAARDECSLRLTEPRSWARGAVSRKGEWQGFPMTHVGAVAGELEFQRFRPRRALAEALRDCDLIQVVGGSPAWGIAVTGLGKPVSLQCATRAKVERRVRDARVRSPLDLWRKTMTQVTDRIECRALRTADAIQVENPWMLEYARALNAGRDVDLRYAPPGVDAQVYRPANRRDPLHDPYVLCVGRLDDPRKNVGLLLEAFSRTGNTVPGLRLVLAGQAGPRESFWRRAESLGVRERISFVERPTAGKLVELYQCAAVFALPSDEEGLGIVLLEAMACGIPAVSTRSGGPDGVIEDGVDGFLVARDDAASMADRIARMCGDPSANIEIGRRARRTIEARYSLESAGATFLDVWQRLIEGREQRSCAA
jgi:glycosyltransferase involved in cell wall biosynthesis